jgi:hypothetical protein
MLHVLSASSPLALLFIYPLNYFQCTLSFLSRRDDHDIFDGWGSYDPGLQACPVFQGLFSVAKRFYLLFQQHTTPSHELAVDEYIDGARGFHSVKMLGPQVALLCLVSVKSFFLFFPSILGPLFKKPILFFRASAFTALV